ncbi:hypothetical protein FA95DRAFT_1563626 [Auriscalpium vulgare]|uniref:Uncharacterized protein n=1 Tax=Auriscalpium vulgare TaxID=40419 RepID=A0ACB8RHG0_9AGAM|nr:hypothetical protein FA95DRAFT_1563626 [Auriscalpium vulgare]
MFEVFVSAPAVVFPRSFAFLPRIAMCSLYPRASQPMTLSSSTRPTARRLRRPAVPSTYITQILMFTVQDVTYVLPLSGVLSFGNTSLIRSNNAPHHVTA